MMMTVNTLNKETNYNIKTCKKTTQHAMNNIEKPKKSMRYIDFSATMIA